MWEYYSLELIQVHPLHLDDLIVAGAIVERVRLLREVVHDSGRI